MSKRIEAAEAYARAMRTGEFPAVEQAEKALADDVKLNGATVWGRQGATVEGKKDVLYRITGVWPNTPVYRRGFWGFPKEEGDKPKEDAPKEDAPKEKDKEAEPKEKEGEQG